MLLTEGYRVCSPGRASQDGAQGCAKVAVVWVNRPCCQDADNARVCWHHPVGECIDDSVGLCNGILLQLFRVLDGTGLSLLFFPADILLSPLVHLSISLLLFGAVSSSLPHLLKLPGLFSRPCFLTISCCFPCRIMHCCQLGVLLCFPRLLSLVDFDTSASLLVAAVDLKVPLENAVLQFLLPPGLAGAGDPVLTLELLDLPGNLLLGQQLLLPPLPVGLALADVVLAPPGEHVLAAAQLGRGCMHPRLACFITIHSLGGGCVKGPCEGPRSSCARAGPRTP
mmetsp:Transcript_48716/g.139314  ORF Transcript_48716/g.139314 Transcript_48716/m.139314 type:complete len:282 (+) Transcript_48716:77-922(+)